MKTRVCMAKIPGYPSWPAMKTLKDVGNDLVEVQLYDRLRNVVSVDQTKIYTFVPRNELKNKAFMKTLMFRNNEAEWQEGMEGAESEIKNSL